MSTTKKTIKITENELINLIDKIATETVAVKKKEWLAEQAKAKPTMLENKIASLEAKLNKLTEGKK